MICLSNPTINPPINAEELCKKIDYIQNTIKQTLNDFNNFLEKTHLARPLNKL